MKGGLRKLKLPTTHKLAITDIPIHRRDALEGGLNKNGHLKSLSMHHYDGGGEEWIRLGTSLMNHTAIAANVSSLDDAIEAAHTFHPYLPYVLGETNSDSSNLNFTQVIGVFGSSLWLIDRTFMAMAAVSTSTQPNLSIHIRLHAIYPLHTHPTLRNQPYRTIRLTQPQNIQRMNLIQGTTFGYTGWVPVSRDNRDPYVRPPLYGQIFAADAIGLHPQVQVYPLSSSTENFSTHAVYESEKLAKYVLINFDEWNSTTPYARPKKSVQLRVPMDVEQVRVERLTASGASADEGVKWAGVSWNYTDGRLVESGTHEFETVKAKKGVAHLDVASTEAALVTLENC